MSMNPTTFISARTYKVGLPRGRFAVPGTPATIGTVPRNSLTINNPRAGRTPKVP